MTDPHHDKPEISAEISVQEAFDQIKKVAREAFDASLCQVSISSNKPDPNLLEILEAKRLYNELNEKSEKLEKKNKELQKINQELATLNLAITYRKQLLSSREILLDNIINFMYGETIALFLIIILVACKVLEINEVTLQVFVGGTILQISSMLIVIIKSVYSDSLNKRMLRVLPDYDYSKKEKK
jgi:hypothetical protein